ncbi:MAG TPA: DUF4280 domain-containing protein [Vicinamibacterales bacterium]|nr:DUF4280 domain-containing protein [Vicinamibacterales bacterium]
MGTQVCSGAAMTCSFGAAPSTLTVLPDKMVQTSNLPAATIMDHKPMVNIMPFGMCMSAANPTVASATAAALGVLTPMPCIPVTTAPWAPGSATVMIKNVPTLNESSKLMCNWGGVIAITTPGQFTHHVP